MLAVRYPDPVPARTLLDVVRNYLRFLDNPENRGLSYEARQELKRRHIAELREAVRDGFTLIELLIVVSIISILLLLTMQVMGVLITSARENATAVTIRKVSRMLADRAESLDRRDRKRPPIETSVEYATAGLLTSDTGRRKSIARKLIYRAAFPQSKREWEQAQLISPAVNIPTHIVSAANPSSGAILFTLLTTENIGGELPEGADGFSTSEVRDADGDGLPEFVDAWGNPLRFYRWPTRLFRPSGVVDPNNVTSGIDATSANVLLNLPAWNFARDPDDPLHRLTSDPAIVNLETVGLPADPAYARPAIAGPIFHTAATYHTLLVVSAGPDGILGLYEPDDTAHSGHLAAVKDAGALLDDITWVRK